MGHTRYAITRDVPRTFDRCIQLAKPAEAIAVERAREQHRAYRAALEALGCTVLRIAADDRYPDCCFVEDPAVVLGGAAAILNVGAASRVGEEVALRMILARYKEITEIGAPATLEGGDVLRVGATVYVGRSRRSNEAGLEALGDFAARMGLTTRPVEIEGVLHLKSACTALGDRCVVLAPDHVDAGAFGGLERIPVPDGELPAANCVEIAGQVIVQKGFPGTRARIEQAGFETLEVDTSEFGKAGGGLTCLSLIC